MKSFNFLRLLELGAKMIKCKPIIIFASLIALSAFLTGLALVLTPRIFEIYRVTILLRSISIFAINFLPIFLLMSLFYFLTNRIFACFSLTAGVVLSLALINRMKLRFREDPLIMGDIFYISEAVSITEGFDTALSLYILSLILVVICIVILAFVFLKKYKIDNTKIRVVGVLAILLCAFLLAPLYQSERIYNQVFQQNFGNNWNMADVYENRGVIYSFLFSSTYSFPTTPEKFSEEEARTALSQYLEMEFENRVHIITIMLEGYEDFSFYMDFDPENNPYAFLHELMDISLHGRLVVQQLGSGTHLTERSFLAGYINHGLYRRTTESFVQFLNRNGYRTVAMHPNDGWFYNRRNVMENIGFDDFFSGTNKFFHLIETYYYDSRFRGWMSDLDFFPYIIRDFEEAVALGEWYFNFSITIQNHQSSFHGVGYSEFNYFEGEVSDEILARFNEYLEGVRLTNEALREVHYYFSNHPEPVVLIIFGDHKPTMGAGGFGYEELGIDISGQTPEALLNRFSTPYIIYANDSAKRVLGYAFVGEGPTISANYLFPLFFELSGEQGSPFMSYLNSLRRNVPVIHDQFFMQGEELVLSLNGKYYELLREFEHLEYYLQHRHR